ncbi:MipA/OmpV family protein [uncultured Cohaesibacter sp.]|uniref:MipA/OmpV family protein n=1 Tax=uncultured Cohaesibacter sp. TaxID=1002546 RepID=UPI0029C95ABC|nr:MipA/OmpV family protein [uncultured Cohaesibacter sp.]
MFLKQSPSLLISLPMVAFMLTGVARAADLDQGDSPALSNWYQSYKPTENDWNIAVGAGVMYAPKYEGSDNFGAIPIPDISVEYKDGLFFANAFDGIGSYFLQGEQYKVGASIGFDLGRREKDDKKNLRGMGNIEMSPTANLMGEYKFGPVQLSGKISRGSEDYGTTGEFDVGTMVPVTEKLMLMGSVGATVADDAHMKSFFGVSAAQSAASGYSKYDAGAGVKSVGVALGAFYSLSDHWDAKLLVKADHLLGDAADSPITKQEFQPAVMFSTSYKF